ncbi:MAG: hypothetical protein DBY07_04510 [Clostridiales bacterium]|nr:MAG: hypothetical protein DBY07_04510 [Clostridiales bacterium]
MDSVLYLIRQLLYISQGGFTMTALTMLVTYKAKPGMRQTYVQQLRSSGILKKIREENGCLSYDFYFSEEDENTLLLVEQWQDADCQKIHLEQPHMKEAMAVKEQYIDQTSVVKASTL